MVTYIRCSGNNSASTVMGLFLDACRTYTIPSRVRCDFGTENVEVSRWMLQTRGLNCQSIITGSSVHNQRLWRDLRCVVVRPFANLLYYLEDVNLLDPLNDRHLFALH